VAGEINIKGEHCVLINVNGQIVATCHVENDLYKLGKKNVKFKQVSVIVILVKFELTQLNYGITNWAMYK
jgi:hypothetical protein